MRERPRHLDHSLDTNRGDERDEARQDAAPKDAPPPASEIARPGVDEPARRRAKPAPEGLLEDDLDPASGARGPERLGRYRLDRLVGSGGMGVVYEAWDEVLRRRVAVKVLGPGAQSQIALERFQQEALLTARLNHPHVVVVHEAGQAAGRAFIAMEYVDGHTLEHWIDQRLGPAAQLDGDERETARRRAVSHLGHEDVRGLCAQIRDVADALHHGHTHTAADATQPTPIIHRDVKPGNIMIDRHGQSRLLDFGLAKELGVALTVTREALGTPLYMSPEQLFSAKRVGPRSDIYSLGMTLYACLTLARPFELSQPGRLFQQLMHDDPQDPQRLNPGLPDDLRTIVLKAIAKDERERYATAAALAADLDAYLEGREIQARPPSVLRRLQRKARRHKRGLVVAAVALALAAATLTVRSWEAHAAVVAARRDEQARATARSNAVRQATWKLRDARLAFELAALNKAEDPNGERWLRLLNEGYLHERDAFEGLAEADARPTVEIQRLGLLARIARNETPAVGELRRLHQSALTAVARRGHLASLLDRLRAFDAGARAQLAQALAELMVPGRGSWGSTSGDLAFAVQIRDELGGPVVADLLSRAQDQAGAGTIDWLQSLLQERFDDLRHLAEAAPALEASLASLNVGAVVRVDEPSECVDSRVTITRLVNGESAGVVAQGRKGQLLSCDAWGELLATVRTRGREARLRFELPQPRWGAPPASLQLSLVAAPDAGPEGMRLVQGAGVDPFWVDAAEVSVGDYARFLEAVEASGHASCPAEVRDGDACRDHAPRTTRAYPAGAPVTGIDYFDALAYAAWAGKQLPTAAQWEAAAFGGGAPTHALANLPGYDDGFLWAAGAGQGATSPCGATGLVGNVAEWLLRTDPDLPFCTAAGGSWAAPLPPRERGYRERFEPTARGEDLGFRCVVPIAVPPPVAPALELVDPVDGAPMVFVPGGELVLLPEQRRAKRRPYQRLGERRPPTRRGASRGQVALSPFHVDRSPVSNAAFARFCRETGHATSADATRRAAEQPHAPAEVLWEDAAAYARWAGKRLPTEAEWEGAYRALEVWGQGPEPASFVAEWCQDMYHQSFFYYANRQDPLNRWGGPLHVIRDGAERYAGAAPQFPKARAAFRCVRESQRQEQPR